MGTMDSMPYVFCSSVIAILYSHSSNGINLSSKIWRKAVENDANSRLNCELNIGYNNGVWSYWMVQSSKSKLVRFRVTFSELKEHSKRDLRIVKVVFSCNHEPIRTSFDEIQRLVKYTAPCANTAHLFLCNTKNSVPADDLLSLLSCYKSWVFRMVYTSKTLGSIQEFLLSHFQSNHWEFHEDHSLATDAFCNFALHQKFEILRIRSEGTEFGIEFFEQLFNKRVTRTEQYDLNWSLRIVQLLMFKSKLRIPPGASKNSFQWQRTDGVRVDVKVDDGKIVGLKIQHVLAHD